MHEDLAVGGVAVSPNRAARLVTKHGIQGWSRKKRGRLGRASNRPQGIQNHLERYFSALGADTEWVIDITEIPTQEGKPVSLRGPGFIQQADHRLVCALPAGLAEGNQSRSNGCRATSRQKPGDIAFRSRQPVHQR
tara:strand:- start:514 stop:921 length:408 start_codon:yes stop_codon:yes gene_type:complete